MKNIPTGRMTDPQQTAENVLATPHDEEAYQEPVRVWHILTALDPLGIETLLQEENTRCAQSQHPPFQYFVPYNFLKRRIANYLTPEEEAEKEEIPAPYFNPKNRSDVAANNELRSALKRYIFIKATSQELERLLTEKEQRQDYRTLWYYRDSARRPVTVSDNVMERFIDACCDKRIQFEVWPAIENIEENDEVVLNVTQFKGYKARVLEVHTDRQGDITLTVGFHLFQGAMLLKLPHLREQDLIFESKDATAATREANRYKFVEDTQRRLFAIWSRRASGQCSEKSFQRDVATLDLINTYRYRFFVSPTMRRKFKGLMLLCSLLRGDKDDVAQFTRQVEKEVQAINCQSEGKLCVDLRAFLQAMLFLATRQEAWRTQALAYFTSRPKLSETHRQLVKWLKG